jgi:hypothetical protein
MNLYNKDILLSDFSYWQSNKLYTQLTELIDGQKFEEEFYQAYSDTAACSCPNKEEGWCSWLMGWIFGDDDGILCLNNV